MGQRNGRRSDVIVLGAGAAGLAAARDLTRAGLTATVVEARGRVGGRVHTIRDSALAVPLELGAEFVHGEAKVTFDVIRAAGLLAAELPDTHHRSTNGRLAPTPGFWDAVEAMGRDLERRITRRKSDFPVAQYLDEARLPSERRAMLASFVEGFHAAYPDRLSARALAGSNGGGEHKQFRILSGGDALLHWLRDGLDPDKSEIRLGTVARAIRWKRGEVSVDCANAAGTALVPLRARCAVITLPHAVLRSGLPRFDPALPDKERALTRLETGHVFKIVLRFRRAFWEDQGFVARRLNRGPGANGTPLAFVHAYELDIPTWWTPMPARAPLLTGWAGGPRADAIYARDPRTRLDSCLSVLARVLAVPRSMIDDLLDSWAMHDWRSDPYSRGAYAYVGVGGVRAQRELAKPVQRTLFLAGEATDAERTGTVAGALASGQRAAEEVIDTLGS